jgi:D-alanine-D-alanine ligase
MLAIKPISRAAPRIRRSVRRPALARPGKVLVGYSAVEKLNRGEARDLKTDLETIDTAKGLAQNLRAAGFDADTHIVQTLADVDFVAGDCDLNELLFFNLCEHLNGVATDDVKITARLDQLGIHYTGAATASLKRCLDKARTKHVLELNDLPTAPYQVFTCAGQVNRVPLPAIVKPVAEDASLGITRESVVFDEPQLCERVQYVLEVYRQPALVEEYVVGREFNVGLWGNGQLHVLPIAELSFARWADPYQQFCHFDAKWNPDSLEYQTMPVICPADIDPVLAERIDDVARRSYVALGCRDYARVDLRVRTDADGNTAPYVLEVNPNPCLAPDAGFSNAARVAGYDYPAMAAQIADWAWWRRGRHA